MSKLNFILGLGIATALTFSANTLAADYKIGVVRIVPLLEAAPQAEAAKKKLEAEFGGKEKALVSKQKELKSLEDRAAKDGAIMSEAERTRLERDVMNMRRELKRDSDEARDDMNFRRNEELAKIQKQVAEAIQAIAAEQKYDLVLGEGVIFASKAIDMTEMVIDRLKKSGK